MDTVSDTIYEIFGAILLMLAISILIAMNTAGTETTKAIDANVRSKMTITEGLSSVDKEEISGAGVYYNICQYAKDESDIKIYLEETEGHKTAVTQSVLNTIKDQGVSQTLMGNISMDASYRIIYSTDTNGTIKSVTYKRI